MTAAAQVCDIHIYPLPTTSVIVTLQNLISYIDT